MITWSFWLPDEDRNSGWSNHTYCLQFVCEGRGDTIEQAWEDAKARDDELGLPESFEPEPSRFVVTKKNEERVFETEDFERPVRRFLVTETVEYEIKAETAEEAREIAAEVGAEIETSDDRVVSTPSTEVRVTKE